ncbi:hypothetical protein [Alteraurantiacibacter aquimixticola]|uniref:Cytochrome c domain-containing protein n=1 Tax=Alteraurantiacibacter aquimixticola TaxID=2489173 RepID=A0A4T3F969_9SPHN|nr:hypothetical protein [Alteraurantiacibacter aquimixticola]TIX51570.1 hypothetical protein E5222_03710 [Alteraurantiacibacter aquimixticola]
MRRILSQTALMLPIIALAGCGEEPVEMPYGTAQQFMANEVQPTAEIYWGAVGAVSELVDGEAVFTEFEPETDEEWAKVSAAAVKLREFGEVLASPAYADGRGDDWLQFAQGLQDVATQAEEAALAKDPEAVFEVGGTVYAVCTACHQMYPPAELPEGETVDTVQTDANRPNTDETLEEYMEGSGE